MNGLRGLWGRMFPVVTSLLLLAGTAHAAGNISGTVTNNTGRTGRVFVYLDNVNGGGSGFGVSIPNPAPNTPFMIRGVPNGTYLLKAFVDGAGTGSLHANDPAWSSTGSITINNDSYSGPESAVTFTTVPNVQVVQTAPVLAARIIPGDNGAMVFWDEPKDANGKLIADSYNVYYSTSSSDPRNGGLGDKIVVPSGNEDFVSLHYGNGTNLAVQVEYVVKGAPSPVLTTVAEMPVGPPATPSGISIFGTIDVAGFVPTGTLYVAAVEQGVDGPPSNSAFVTDSIQLAGNSFALSGVAPNKTYVLYLFIDMNNDGRLGAGDVMVPEPQAPVVSVGGADVTLSAPVTLMAANATPYLNTIHSQDSSTPPNDGYTIRIGVESMTEIPVNVTITSGPTDNGLSYPIDLGLNVSNGGGFDTWCNVGNTRPQLTDVYTLNIQYAGGVGSDTVNLPVTAVLDSFATLNDPVGYKAYPLAGSTPYSWSAPSTPPAPYTYSFWVNHPDFWPNNNELFWNLPSSTTTATPSGLTYADGTRYDWTVSVRDSYGNQAQKSGWFSAMSSPVITGFTPTTAAPGMVVTVDGFNFDPTPENNRVDFSGGVSSVAQSVTPDGRQLTVVVPSGARSGVFQVTVGGKSFISQAQLTILGIVWGVVDSPTTQSVKPGVTTAPIKGLVYMPGVTDAAAGPAPGLVAELGYGPAGTAPTSSSWVWTTAAYDTGTPWVSGESFHSFVATLTVTTVGTYDYAYRYSYSGGTYLYGDTYQDRNGNLPLPNPGVLTVALPVPAITSPANGTLQKTTSLVVSGTAEAGSPLNVYDGVTLIGTTMADGNGSWAYSMATLGEGPHSLTARVTDTYGNTSGASAAVLVTVDSIAPLAPVVTSPVNGTAVNTYSVTMSGTAEANSTVKVYGGGGLRGSVTADGSGNWTVGSVSFWTYGANNFTVTATDAALNESPATAHSLILDVTAPGPPTITSPANGALVNTTTPTISGTAEANSTVKVYDGGSLLGSAPANGSGSWSYTTGTLTQGAHSFTATATDTVGNTGGASAAAAVTIDSVAPLAPSITTPTNGVLLVTTAPTISGTAEVNSTVKVYDGAVLLGSTSANGSGNWTYTPAILDQGPRSLTATATDAAGNTGPSSTAVGVTIDTVAPDTSITATPAALTNTTGATFTFNGTDATSGVASLECDLDSGGFSPCTSPKSYTGLGDGSHIFQVRARDVAGFTDASPASYTWTIDTTAPTVTGFTIPATATSLTVPVSGFTATDGTGVTGYMVTDSPVAPLPSAAGWNSLVPANVVFAGPGSRTAYAWARDGAGNVSASVSQPVTITLPTTTVLESSLNPSTYGQQVTFTATVTPSAAAGIVQIDIDGGTPYTRITLAGAPVSWTTTLPAGTHTVTATYYSSDSSYSSSASSVLTQTVNKAAPTVNLSLDSSTVAYGGSVTATATLPATATGTVQFMVNGSNYGLPVAMSGGRASIALAGQGASVTPYDIQASYSGDGNYTTATSTASQLTVNKASAAVTLGGLSFTYDSTAKATTATTVPAGLTVTITYDGSATAPTIVGNYAVVATINDANYQGSAAGTLVIGKAAAIVTLGDLSQTYTGNPLSATATTTPAGLTVDFTYNGSATAPTSAGSYTVVGTINDANYQGSVSGTLAVAKATAAVTLGAMNSTYDGTARVATAATVPAGLAVAFTYDGSSTAPTTAGSYAVVATVNDANYQGTANGTLNIAPAALTVTASNASRAYGAANPVNPGFAITSGTLVGTDAISSVIYTYQATATATAAAGSTHNITPSAAVGTGLANYAITYLPGTLTITKAPLTVTADNKVRFEKVANPAFTATYTGLVNGETAAALGGTLAFATTATPASAPGSYPVTPSGLTSSNYTITFAPGSLTVRVIGDITGAAGTPDGIFNVADPLKYLRMAVGLDPAPASLDGVKLAPVTGGVPTASAGSRINIGDVVAALEHLVGLW